MKKTTRLATLSLASLLGVSLAGNVAFEIKGEASLEGLELEDVYNIGDLLYIPKSATLNEEGKSIKIASSELVYPSGNSLSSSSYKLDAYGTYSLTINGEDGTTYSKSFSVYQDVYSFSDEDSSIDYGSLNSNFKSDGYSSGLRLNIKEGDTFTFAQPIDLSKSTYQKLISWNVLDLLDIPSVTSISVKVTDAYDANNYFTITNTKGAYYYLNYFSASYNGGRSAGINRDDTGPIVIDGESYRLSSSGGTTMSGNQPISGVYNNISYYLDTSDANHYRIYADNGQARESVLISEFNNSGIYSDTFAGFKTGLAYISLTASGYSGIDTAPIEIGEIGGIKGEELNPMDYYKDTIAPIIDISSNEKANIMGGIEIAIPEAKAYDETALRGEVESSVWYGYDSSSRSMVSVKNGSFLPDKLGTYSVIYEAEDVYGNLTSKRIDLSVTSFGNEGISFELLPLEGLKAGTSVKLNNYKVTSLNDDAEVEVELVYPNGTKKTLSSGEGFDLDYSGTYHATYFYKDSFYSGSKSMDFDVAANTEAAFSSKEVALPHYFMKGASYTIDVPAAYTYGTSGKTEDEILSYVSFDGGEYVVADPHDLSITGSKSVKLRFVAKSNSSSVLETEEIPVVDTGWDGKKVDLTKYFVGDYVGENVKDSSDKNEDYVRYVSQKDGDASMEFVNRLLLTGFTFSFKATECTSLTVRMVSYYDPSTSVEIVFEGGKVSVNGRSQTATESYKESGASIFYSESTSTLSVAGAKFDLVNPFERDSFLLEVEAKGTKSGDYIDVSNVGNQVWRSGTTRDRVAPMASATFPTKIASLNDEATISAPNVADVLTPSSDAKVTMDVIKNVGGTASVMKDKNSGKELSGITDYSKDYEILMDSYGSYVITYSISDLAGNSVYGGLQGMVSVLDMEKPVLTNVPEKYTIKMGVLSDLPNITATDNITKDSAFEIWHLIYDSSSRLVTSVQNGDQVTITEKGTYTVYVTCQDEEGNLAYGSYTLIVE